MKKNLTILIILLCVVKLTIHLVGNQNYGFHRDELLHLSVSEHLAWGYMEFPPLIAFIGKAATTFFDHSLSGIRFFSTLAGIGIVILVCLMTIEMGAQKLVSVLSRVLLSFRSYRFIEIIRFFNRWPSTNSSGRSDFISLFFSSAERKTNI